MMTELQLATILLDGAIAQRKAAEAAFRPYADTLLAARVAGVAVNMTAEQYMAARVRALPAEKAPGLAAHFAAAVAARDALAEAHRLETQARFRVAAARPAQEA